MRKGDRRMALSQDVKQERDLYVAFAFAGADLLLEVGADGRVVFAIGAAMSLLGRPARLLAGLPMVELFHEPDRPRILRALDRIAGGARLRHLLVRGLRHQGAPVPLALSGYRHPDRPDALLLVLSFAASLMRNIPSQPDGELLGPAQFSALAGRLLNEGGGPGDAAYQLTLLELPALEDLRSRAGNDAVEAFIAEMKDYLRTVSVGGEAAGDLGNNRYGVVHETQVSTGEIEDVVAELARTTADIPDFAAAVSSLNLDARDLSMEEAANALVYTVTRFGREGGMTLRRLETDVQPRLSATVAQIRSIKAMIASGDFALHYQPVVDLWTHAIHHFEGLVRFGRSRRSPFETVAFAEDVGIAGQLDEAICLHAFAQMRSGVAAVPAIRVAVNLSGRSLTHPPTARRLLALIRSAADLRGRLMFELTESAEIRDLDSANAVIQEIRAAGHPVCLDDFGAGSAAFHYLRALTVDVVKIDGSYVQDVVRTGRAMPFLKAITQLCRDLKVSTVAEHVEDEETANLLRILNVNYGQGWYFGKALLPRRLEANQHQAWQTGNWRWRKGLLFFHPAGSPPAALPAAAPAPEGSNR